MSSNVKSRFESGSRFKGKRWKEERFFGPGAPKGLIPGQKRWHSLYQRAKAYREGRAELATMIVGLSARGQHPPHGDEPVDMVPFSPTQQFVGYNDMQINLLYHLNRPAGPEERPVRLHFTSLFGQPDESNLIVIDAANPVSYQNGYKTPIRPHQTFETIHDRAELTAPIDGVFTIVHGELYCDLCVDDDAVFRFELESAGVVEFLKASGTRVRRGQVIALVHEPVEFAKGIRDADGYWEMDYGGGDLIRAFDVEVLDYFNDAFEMMLDCGDGLCPALSSGLVLPRSYHAVPDGVKAKVNVRSEALVDEFCRAIGVGAEDPYQVLSPWDGEVSEVRAMEAHPINPANAHEGTTSFYAVKIGDKWLPGRLPSCAMLYVLPGMYVRKGDLLADPVRRDYYENIVDVEAVVPGLQANWLLRDFASRFQVDFQGQQLWPTHLLSQETVQVSTPVADLRPCLPHQRPDGKILLAVQRAGNDVLDVGSWSLRTPSHNARR